MALPEQVNIPSVAKQGVRVAGLDAATPTGTGSVTIGDFTAAADTNLATNAASLPLSEWYARTDSQVNGTTVTFTKPGQYTVQMHVAMGTAVRIQAGILRGNAAPPANPLLSAGVRILAAFDVLGAAAGSFHTVTLTAILDVADADIDGNNNTIRFQYSNGAGAAPVGLIVAENGYTITRGLAVQSLQ